MTEKGCENCKHEHVSMDAEPCLHCTYNATMNWEERTDMSFQEAMRILADMRPALSKKAWKEYIVCLCEHPKASEIGLRNWRNEHED